MSNTTKLRITVTKEILERSKMCAVDIPKHRTMREVLVSNCAIALAVKDVWPKAKVELHEILPFGRRGESTEISLPAKATIFIEKFDEASPEKRSRMKPFDFEVEVPNAVIKKINIDEIRPLLQNHPTLELIEQ